MLNALGCFERLLHTRMQMISKMMMMTIAAIAIPAITPGVNELLPDDSAGVREEISKESIY